MTRVTEDDQVREDGKWATAYLDGELLLDCVDADDEAGIVYRLAYDAEGKPMYQDDKILVYRQRGAVKIEYVTLGECT